MDSTRKQLISILPPSAECSYAPYYCEENVYKLCEHVRTHHPAELQHCRVVFVSNEKRVVPLWRQRSGKEEEKLVIWDYHALFLYKPDERCVVYDLDSELPFPTYFHKYVTETFRTDQILKPMYFRYFRIIPASLFLQKFASDRRHMRREDGTWSKPPPSYPAISQPGCVNNLDEFIDMDPKKSLGEVMNLTELVKQFYQQG
ncbi:protein N-terminal glutamine amidohydrolase [Ischnura elegans]|uniref:protein N-terminal glutamine amidohydrolase n=1 Tax=Ischnura elegans TaxID=197161 RepID=UPI001ED884C3|nr:protein N-terminal glutamine amidohydrolase [Ischnura elegans]